MKISLVTTLYRSASHLEEFYSRASEAAVALTDDFEVVFVNDGSPDNSLEIALAIREGDARVSVIDLSRNFGHHRAMMTGLAHAKGDLIFLIDCDLEEEPELLGRFLEELRRAKADVVFGVQPRRKGRWFERLSGSLFFKVFNLLSTDPIPENLITARLMTKRYVAALVQHQEREFIIAGLWALTGFEQVAVPVVKHHRGSSSYGLGRKTRHLVNAITSFSGRPLVLIFYLGTILVVLAGLAALDLIIRKLVFGQLLQGWASLIVSIWLLGGITIFCLGVVAIYLSKIFIEVKRRPYAIVRKIYHGRKPVLAKLDRDSAGRASEETDGAGL